LIYSSADHLDIDWLRFSNSGRWLAASFSKGTNLAILPRPAGSPVSVAVGGRVAAMVFAPDDRQLFVALEGGSLATIDLTTLSVQRTALGRSPRRLLYDNNRLLVGTTEGDLVMVDPEHPSAFVVLSRHPSRVEGIVKRRGTTIVTYRDGVLGLLDDGSLSPMRTVRVCRESVGALRAGADGYPVAVLCRNGLLKFISPASLNMDVVKVADDATSMTVSGNMAITGDMEGHVTGWLMPTLSILDRATINDQVNSFQPTDGRI
jgi:hypothetical protein